MPDPTRAYWDMQAPSFDDEPDHGLGDRVTRNAWRELLGSRLPTAPADVVDLGCGTGTLAVLLAEAGHRVRGVDLSTAMVERAEVKARAAGVEVVFSQGDAGDPPYAPGSCDVVLCRHVLWALPDPSAALRTWVGLLRPDGRLLLVEGHWHTGGGLTAQECERLVLAHRSSAVVQPLDDPVYWGGPISDERYLLVSAG